jgi:hypothetical protein
MTRKTISCFAVSVLCVSALIGCSHTEPLETSLVAPTSTRTVPVSDQSAIAEAVGNAPADAGPLAWANPSTGSAGVIERIAPATDSHEGCRGFVSSNQGLEGVTKFGGFAFPSDGTWKIAGTPGLH